MDVTRDLADALSTAGRDQATRVGIDWAPRRAVQLFGRGVRSVHVYVTRNTRPFVAMIERLRRAAVTTPFRRTG